MTGGERLMEALIGNGVDFVFGYPGGAIMPTYDALLKADNVLRHVLVRHEQAAAHAAQGYARASGKTGVCLVTSGPGATNLLTGLTDALMDSTPLVAIAGQVPGEALGSDGFQECDIIGMSLSATKWSYQITCAEEIPAIMNKAFQIAATGRPGPVLIDITKDAQLERCEAEQAQAQATLNSETSPLPATTEELALSDAVAVINAAERPYLMLGQGVLLARAEEQAVAFAERINAPTACTLLGLSAFPPDHPLYVGMLGMHGNYGANHLTDEADVIIGVGMRFDDRVTGRASSYAANAKVVHIDIEPSAIGKNVPIAASVVGDAKRVLSALTPLVRPRRNHAAWLSCFRDHDAIEYQEITYPELHRSGPLGMAEVITRLTRATAGAALITSDVGQHQMYVARHYRFKQARSHITSGGLGTMGFALPAAIGAAIHSIERPIIAVIGDGGFQMNVQELGTLAQEGLPVKIIVLNNERLGMVRQWQELFYEERYSQVEMKNPDFVALALSYSLSASRVSDRNDLDDGLKRLLEHTGPYLLEIRVASMENVFPMIPPGASAADIQLSS